MKSFRLDKKSSNVKVSLAPIVLLMVSVVFVGLAASSYIRTITLTAEYDASSSQYDLLLHQLSRNRNIAE